MPRHRRLLLDGCAYHLLNRGNRRQTIFHKPSDYWAFLSILAEATSRFHMPLIAVCLMRNHWHLVVWPTEAVSISSYMHWLLNVHVHRYNRHYGLTGLGHLYQDRYKAFPIQDRRHLYTVMRYVEANPLRARLIDRAEDWEWSSLTLRSTSDYQRMLTNGDRVELPDDWLAIVNDALPEDDLKVLRTCSRKSDPFGDPAWIAQVRKKERGQAP
jgi:putative transposase